MIDFNSIYLKPHVKMELLVCRWMAWSHLVSPVQHAMNIAYRHLPTLQSFVSNPKIHTAAAQDPKLLGGPFVDLPESAVDEIAQLLSDTKSRCGELLTFARDFKQFDKMLQEGAHGFGLQSFYELLPASLAGAVEIAYDLNNHPSLRILEEVVYKYGIDNRFSHELLLSNIADADRKFFMYTPRIPEAGSFAAKLPFSDKRLDALSMMRTHPGTLQEAAEIFGSGSADDPAFQALFTSEAPYRRQPDYLGADVRVRYFGHACILIQTQAQSILIDPMVTWDRTGDDDRFTYMDLPDAIDVLVISHCHQDHFSPEVLVQLRHRVKKVVVPRNKGGNMADPSMKLILQRLGFTHIEVLDAFDSVSLPEGEIVSLPFSGEHADLDIHSKQAILVHVKGRKCLFLVDSDAIDPALYKQVTQLAGVPDALFVGMECYGAPLSWLYGPLLTKPLSRRDDESRRLSASDSERAWRLVRDLGCKKAFIYAMGQEPWLRYVMGLGYEPESVQLQQANRFLTKCREAGIDVEHLNISREMIL